MTESKFNIGEFINKHFTIILVAIGFVLWYTKKDNSGAGRLISSDTTRTQVLQPIVVNPSYQPSQSGSTVYMPVPAQYQPVAPATDISGLVAQVKELSERNEYLAREYFAQKNYKDSITLKDTAGKKVGVVNLNQTVSENTLKSLQSNYQLLFPNTTVTNTVTAKLKNQIFFGASVQSPIPNMKVQQVDIGLLLKNKRETVLLIAGVYDLQSKQTGVRAGAYFKLSFKPKLLPIP